MPAVSQRILLNRGLWTMGPLSFPAENPRREENLQEKLHIVHNEWELKQHLHQETVI